MLRTNSTITRLAVSIIIVLLRPFPCLSGGIKGDKELLKTVALMHKANFDSILTWKGEAIEERRSSKKEDNYDFMLKSKATFAYDQLQNSVRWNREPQEYHSKYKGESYSHTSFRYNSAIITDNSSYTYRMSGEDTNGNETYRVILDEPYKGVQRIGNKGFDPRYFFNYDGSYDFYKHLIFLYENADNPKMAERHVKREGDLVIMTLEKTVENGIRTKKDVFDLSAGGNLIECYSSGPTYENHREYEYEERSGVWVLKSYKQSNITHHEDGDLKSTRVINWSNSVVNVPFEEDEFTIEKLGVKPGDYIQDNKIGIMYNYGIDDIDSGMLMAVDTADMSEETDVTGNGKEVGEEIETDEAVRVEEANEINTATENLMLQTSEASGTHTYIYIISVAIVIGLVGIIYILTHRFRRESDQCINNQKERD